MRRQNPVLTGTIVVRRLDVRLEVIEVTIPKGFGSWALVGVSVRQATLPEGDLVMRHGLPTTSAVRTVFDLCCRPTLVEAVVMADLALHARLVEPAELGRLALTRTGSRGIRQFRRVLDFVEPATESPMETRLRMLLVLNGVPKPEVQLALHDDNGRFVGRADLYYPAQRLVLEYDVVRTGRASLRTTAGRTS